MSEAEESPLRRTWPARFTFATGLGTLVAAITLITIGLRESDGADPKSFLAPVLPLISACVAGVWWQPTRRVAGARITFLVLGPILVIPAIVIGLPPAGRLLDRATAEPPIDAAISNAPTFTLAGAVLGLLAALLSVLHAASLRWRPDHVSADRSAPTVVVTLVAAMIMVGTAALPLVGDAVAEQLNTTAQIAGPAPPAHPSVLDGSVLWASDAGAFGDRSPGQVIATAGGLAVVLEHGVRMIDSATAEDRWRWERADVRVDNRQLVMSVSPDGTMLAVQLSDPDTPRFPEVPSVMIFDAGTGAVRGSIDRAGGSLRAVTEDVVLTTRGRTLHAWDATGAEQWSASLRGRVRGYADSITSSRGIALVHEETDDYGFRTEAIDLTDGTTGWRDDGLLRAVAGENLAVEWDDTGRAGIVVTGRHLADGSEAWEHTLPGES